MTSKMIGDTIQWKERNDLARVARGAVVLLIIATIIALAVDNRHHVEVGYLVGDATAPAWMVLIASAIGGVVIGWLVKHRPGRSR